MTLITKQRQMLIDLRSQLVGKLHTQPFTIYQDEVIENLLKGQPKSLEELAKIKGFPKNGKRVNGFGEAIVAIFTKTNSITGVELLGNGNSLSVRVKLESVCSFEKPRV